MIGKVTEVVPDAAQVSLITDSAVEVTAKISATGAVGLVQPEVGEPGRLLMQIYQSSTTAAVPGDYVVTSGTVASPGDSLYPKGIPIGQVTSVNEQGGFKSVEVSPLADLHSLEFVQVLTYSSGSRAASLSNVAANLTPPISSSPEEEARAGRPGRADGRRRLMSGSLARQARSHIDRNRPALGADGGAAWLPGSLVWRVAVLSVVVVFVQISVVSEVPVFGVSVDLSPLLVAFVGLLCGSTLGAVAGFCVGLLIDLALMQTLGVTSLTFTIIGYWAGRLRELRDPQAALTPLFVGAAAATAAMVGYSVIEFLLGVDAPVSLELLREIVVGVLRRHRGGTADVGAGAPLPGGRAAGRSTRRRRRRAYTTGGLSPLSQGRGHGGDRLSRSRGRGWR